MKLQPFVSHGAVQVNGGTEAGGLHDGKGDGHGNENGGQH
jgi:hypothetical protein